MFESHCASNAVVGQKERLVKESDMKDAVTFPRFKVLGLRAFSHVCFLFRGGNVYLHT